MKAQLLSHEFKTFNSPKTGKTYQLNTYHFVADIKGKKQAVDVVKFGPEDTGAVPNGTYELSPSAWLKDHELQWGTDLALIPTAKAV